MGPSRRSALLRLFEPADNETKVDVLGLSFVVEEIKLRSGLLF